MLKPPLWAAWRRVGSRQPPSRIPGRCLRRFPSGRTCRPCKNQTLDDGHATIVWLSEAPWRRQGAKREDKIPCCTYLPGKPKPSRSYFNQSVTWARTPHKTFRRENPLITTKVNGAPLLFGLFQFASVVEYGGKTLSNRLRSARFF